MNDREIIALFLERNEQAIAETKAKYGSLCRAVARNMLRSAEDAEEGVSDVLLILWNNIPPEQPRSLKAYIAAVTKRCALSLLEKKSAAKRGGAAETGSLDELADCLPSKENVEHKADAKELARLINEWLGLLPAEDRVLFIRRYRFEDGIAELAEGRGEAAQKTVKRLFALRKKLKRFLEKEGFWV